MMEQLSLFDQASCTAAPLSGTRQPGPLRLVGGWPVWWPGMEGIWIVPPECQVFAGFHSSPAGRGDFSGCVTETFHDDAASLDRIPVVVVPHILRRGVCDHSQDGLGLNQVDRARQELTPALVNEMACSITKIFRAVNANE